MGELFSIFRIWFSEGEGADGRQPKIALKCKDTEELEILAAKARSLNLCARTIQDA
jgi:PTH2 family peptidyl-tRNA hydrolase